MSLTPKPCHAYPSHPPQLEHNEQAPVYFGNWEESWRTPGPMGETFDAGHPDHIDHMGSIQNGYWFDGTA